ncbi:MAG: fasciclin domain-containing protein [Patescibacteria group bacterium]|nr:fasciclin domain-containing protein [Patescibacteria group bacterium]
MFKSKKKLLIIIILIIAIGAGIWFYFANNKSNEPIQTQTEDVSSVSDKDLATIINDKKNYKSFNDALVVSGLNTGLQSGGPYTVLVPLNKAFDNLPDGFMENLQKPENLELLKGLINYHIIASKLKSSELTDGQRIPTVNGAELTVKIKDGNVTFIDSKGTEALVVGANIEGSNGVIHEIDSVLIPQ